MCKCCELVRRLGHAPGCSDFVDDGVPAVRVDVQRAVRAAFELQQPNAPRSFRFFRNIVVATSFPVILAALSGCSTLRPDAMRVELSHDSHATVGQFICKRDCHEDGLTRASLILKWKRGPVTIEAGEGWNLQGAGGGGFYGPGEVFTARAGYEIQLRH
jgi:hypothetical protein